MASDHRESPLAGVGVLVTRPAHQAEALCRLIEDAGGRALRFPVLAIEEPHDERSVARVIQGLDDYDLAIFISANAVAGALNRLGAAGRALPPGLVLAAVGKASARELARFGYPPQVCPSGRADSEALLAMDELQNVAGKRIVIFRGEGGRELLADTLRQRGAHVDYAEVYRRVRPDADTGWLMRQWARGAIDIVVVTSGDGLRNLYDMVGKLGREWLRKTPLVVVSERMVQLARELGVRADVLVAEPGDEALIDTLKRWRAASP